ncbi:MAG: VWA domain-containing protein, partial [Sulfitobacter sp.]|nr:VWA domain-containing protein [Sulfitobacter sp.]
KTGSDKAKSGSGSGSGANRTGNRRGRPLPARGGRSGSTTARVDLMATLRAAVPWQTLRRREEPDRIGPILRPSDLRHKRYEELSDRLLIFAVDASGSAALARLAEAKGAVELLLAEAYARRDHVALIAFRGEGAELLLPPTRSLVQTKRRLAELPGGGGTPLAQGLVCGLETALTALRKGLSPTLILLTDGRANITLEGTADRAQAAEDATRMARACAAQGIDSIVIDTSRRPEHALRELALSLRGHYASLPRADAAALSKTVTAALDG